MGDKSSSSSFAATLRENRALVIGASVVAVAAVAAGVLYLRSSSAAASSSQRRRRPKAAKPASKTPAARAAAAAVPPGSDAESKQAAAPSAEAPEAGGGDAAEAPAAAAPVRPEDLTDEERSKQAAQIKGKGNKFYNAKLYDKAIVAYSQAIDMCPPSDATQLAVFYANRAACQAALNRHEEVIADCSKTLEYDPKYTKAYARRAQAYESTNQINDAIIDLTTIINLQKNLPLEKHASTFETYDRLLKTVAQKEVVELLKNRTPQMPSKVFVKAYLDSFKTSGSVYNDGTSVDELNQLIGEGTQDADLYMRRGWAYLRKRDYEEAMEEFSRAAEIGEGKRPAEMYHMRGTFHYLMRRFEEAMLDYNRALDLEPSNVQVLLKRAGLKLEQRDAEGCTADLALAERVGEDDSDLYYQRGQMRFLSEDILGAIQDYRRACDLGHDSVLARIQLAIALWRAQEIDEALKLFDQVRKENPDNADVHNFLGEIFMAEGDFNAARESFEKANELDPESPMSLVNLGLLAFRRSMAMNPAAMMAAGGAGAAGLMGADLGGLGFGGAGNSREELEEVEKARKYLSDALAVDPKFDMAQAHLAQVHMRQERVDLALECYAATVELARTEDELLNAVMCRLAAQAQLDAAKRLPK